MSAEPIRAKGDLTKKIIIARVKAGGGHLSTAAKWGNTVKIRANFVVETPGRPLLYKGRTIGIWCIIPTYFSFRQNVL